MENFGLSKDDIDKIGRIFSNYSQIKKVLIYGSRAKGNYNPSSDIDLTIIGNDIDLSLQFKIESDLDDLMLPYKFDISIYENISNPDLLAHIGRIGKTFYADNP
jgi:type I restriction enzyme S subunit